MRNELTTYRESLGTTNIWRFVVCGLSCRHHLGENELSAFGPDFRQMEAEDGCAGDAYDAADCDRHRRSQQIRKDSCKQGAERRHSDEHHRIDGHDAAA